MTDPAPERPSRMETLAPGVPLAAKVALLAGLAVGLFATIVLSYANPDREYLGIGLGIAAGILTAIALTLRSLRGARSSR